MARARWQATITDNAGNVVPNAVVTVRREISGLPLQTLYSDREGATPIANPTTADSNGFVAFYCMGGAYQIVATSGAFSRTWRHVAIGTSAETDVEDLLVGLEWRSQWLTATLYGTRDGVIHEGTAYICTADHTSAAGTEPGVGASWETVWSVLVERGLDDPTWTFDSATASANPGTGEFRLNNATLASVTAMFISESSNEAGNPSFATWLQLMDDSLDFLRRSIMVIRNVRDRSQFAMYYVGDTITDNGAWDTVTLSHIASNGGPFVASQKYSVSFVQRADPAAGLTWQFSSNTSMADPGAGLFRTNNATLASVTQIAIDDESIQASGDISAWMTSWDDSTAVCKGYLHVYRNDSRANFAVFRIDSLTDNAGWTQLNVTHIASAGSFTDTRRFTFEFSRTGDVGLSSFRQLYDNTSNVMADPGNNTFRLNNATLASVTQIAVDDLADGLDISGYALSFDDSTSVNKGTLYIQQQDDPSKVAIFRVNSLVDNAGWTQINVGFISGSLPTNGRPCVFTFSRTGDAGNGGFRQSFSTTTTMADPGDNSFRFNNATIASVTAIAVDDLAAGVSIETFVATWDDSTSEMKGLIHVQQQDDASKFAVFALTSITDNPGWTQLNVVHRSGVLPDNLAPCLITFVRTGDAGNGGARQRFSTTTTMADPGANTFRFNNATIGSVTAVAVSDTADGVSIESSWLTLDDSTSINKGYLYVQQQDDPARFTNFAITSIVDNTGWVQVNVAFINGVLPANGAMCSFRFSRTGDAGLSDFRQTYDSTSNVMGDPGNNTFRVNNAAWGSVTALAIDDLASGVAIDAYVTSWDDSTSFVKGFLYICQQDNPAKFAMYRVNSLVDNAGWTQLNVTYLNGAAIDNGALVFFSFARTGDRGDPSGLRWLFDSATTMADPGSGDFRLNNATLASVTAMAISDNILENGNPSVEAWLLTWDDSTSVINGYLTLKDSLNPSNFAVFAVGGVTDNTGWCQVALTHVVSSGSFTAATPVNIDFVRAGDKGDIGASSVDFSTLVTIDAVATDDWLVVGDVSDDTPNPDETKRVAVSQFLTDRLDPVFAKITRSINAQTGTTYTFVMGDAGLLCTFSNASAITVTVPPNSSVAFPIGTQIDVASLGAGLTTFAQGAGVTINSEDSKKKLAKRYSAGTLVKLGTDTWLLTGSIAT